ncbi:transposase [Clostridium butyricum]
MRSTGKRYTDDFKKMVIELYNSGKPVLELCSEYGITNPTLYNWLKNPPGNESKKLIIKVDNKLKDVDKDKELLKLQKENERIKEENEILKKAIAMFAKE